MLKIKEFFNSPTSTFSYVIFDETSKNAAIIDSVLDYNIASGSFNTKSADEIISYIKENNLTLEWILETHIHADHITASQYLKENLGGKIAISKHVVAIIPTWQKIFNLAELKLDGSDFDHLFEDDEIFNIGTIKAQIIHCPGHTPVDSCFVIENNIFAGDVIFMPDVGSGRCDFPSGSAEDSFNSIKRLYSYPDDFKIFVGHDYPPQNSRQLRFETTVKEQKESNIRVNQNTKKEDFINKRKADDFGKEVPKLLLPSIQVNLRAGSFGAEDEIGNKYIKIPLNLF